MKLTLFTVLLLQVVCAHAAPPAKSAAEILAACEEQKGPSGDISFLVKAVDRRSTSSQETIYKVFAKAPHYSLIETISPERLRGRKLLMKDDGLWLYLPTLHRPTRVSLQQRLSGEVANGDLARTQWSDDYTPTLGGNTRCGKQNCLRLLLKAKTDEVTYRKIELHVEISTFRPRRAIFYAVSGRPLKTAEFGGYKEVLGKTRSTFLVIRDSLQPSRRSELTYSGHRQERYDVSFFNKESIID